MRAAALTAIIGILILAGCSAETRIGQACTTDADCSWCDDDYLMEGGCAMEEENDMRGTCSAARTISCKRTIGPNGTCALKDGTPACAEKETPPADTGPVSETSADFSDISSYPPCEDGGTCHQYQRCGTGDQRNTVMTSSCVRGHCVPGTSLDCMATYGVVCQEFYLLQHGQRMLDAAGNPMTGGRCVGIA